MKSNADVIEVHRLQAREMEALLRFYLEELSDVDHYWRFFRTMTPESLRLYVDQLPFKDGAAVFGLFAGGRLLGAAEVDFHAGGVADVGIAVSRARRRQGLGRRLLQHVLTQLPALGARRARMSYLKRNRPLAALAASAGFGDERREGEVVLVERAV
ncbi:MAG: GNAT family N-acetyltransferase [Pseudomonadota bacterium]|jgi:GNAT superfamily N-acetyltransferase